jgi:hypothetical protein
MILLMAWLMGDYSSAQIVQIDQTVDGFVNG